MRHNKVQSRVRLWGCFVAGNVQHSARLPFFHVPAHQVANVRCCNAETVCGSCFELTRTEQFSLNSSNWTVQFGLHSTGCL